MVRGATDCAGGCHLADLERLVAAGTNHTDLLASFQYIRCKDTVRGTDCDATLLRRGGLTANRRFAGGILRNRTRSRF